jgi:hypothetical protein
VCCFQTKDVDYLVADSGGRTAPNPTKIERVIRILCVSVSEASGQIYLFEQHGRQGGVGHRIPVLRDTNSP